MTVTVYDRRSGEQHTGRTPESVARRVWGRHAELRLSADPSDAGDGAILGRVVRRDPQQVGVYFVLAEVVVSGLAASADPLLESVTECSRTAAEALEARDEAIRQAVTAGLRATDIARAAGISRERVYQIRDGRR